MLCEVERIWSLRLPLFCVRSVNASFFVCLPSYVGEKSC